MLKTKKPKTAKTEGAAIIIFPGMDTDIINKALKEKKKLKEKLNKIN